MEEEACKKRRVVPIPSPMTSRFNLPDKNVCTPFHFHSKLGHCASPPRGCRNFIFIKWIHGNGCPSFTNRGCLSSSFSILLLLLLLFRVGIRKNEKKNRKRKEKFDEIYHRRKKEISVFNHPGKTDRLT